jgi:hypothetical protein
MLGPTSTLGLGIPDASQTTSQLTSTVQGTQQTVSTTVTNVESTVDSTVQIVQQTATQVAAPQPAPAPTPASAPAATSAPKQTVARVAAPVKKHVAAATAPRTAVTRSSAGSRALKQATETVSHSSAAVRTSAQKVAAVKRLSTRGSASDAGDAPALDCNVPLIDALPGAAELGALLNLVCSAAQDLILPARAGLDPAPAADTSRGDVLGTSVSAPTAQRSRARSAGLPIERGGRDGFGSDVDAAAAGRPTSGGANPYVAATGRAGALAYLATTTTDHAKRAAASTNQDSGFKTSIGRWLGGQSAGTLILLGFLTLCLTVIAAVAARRHGLRWALRPLS